MNEAYTDTFLVHVYATNTVLRPRCIRWNVCRARARFNIINYDTGREADACGRHLQMFLEKRLDDRGRLGNKA